MDGLLGITTFLPGGEWAVVTMTTCITMHPVPLSGLPKDPDPKQRPNGGVWGPFDPREC